MTMRAMTCQPMSNCRKKSSLLLDRGYTFVAHQQEVGTGYFDDVTNVIQGGQSSVTALRGSTEEEQFNKSPAA